MKNISELELVKRRRIRYCRCPECEKVTPVNASSMYGGEKRNLTTCAHCFICFDATERHTWLAYPGEGGE